MSLNISSEILSLPGQRVKSAQHDLSEQKITILCDRDHRFRTVDPVTGCTASVNRYVRRTVRDLPLCGLDCYIEIELAQVITADGHRRMESSVFVDTGVRFTQRFCHLVSGLCRHMSIQAVALYLGLRWETVKNIDKAYLSRSPPALDPSELKGLKYPLCQDSCRLSFS